MYAFAFIAAFAAFIGLTIFIYFCYPAKWRRNNIANAVLIAFHAAGVLSLGAVFVVYKIISFEWLKRILTVVATFYYIIVMLLAIFFAIRLAVVLVKKLIRRIKAKRGVATKSDKTQTFSAEIWFSIASISVAIIIATAGFFNAGVIRDTRYEITINKTCSENLLTVALIADIHAGSGTWDGDYEQMSSLLNRSGADVILIAGDAFDETTCERDIESFCQMLSAVNKPRYGIYFVYGNHDEERAASAAMREIGITVLEDEAVLIGEEILLIGRSDPKHSEVTTEQLLSSVDIDSQKPVIMLAHRPEDFEVMSNYGVDLAVAGHTHGFNIPQFLGANLFCDMYYGVKSYGKMTAITTSGASEWGFKYKFPAISEVVTISIRFI